MSELTNQHEHSGDVAGSSASATSPVSFRLLHTDGVARRGQLSTPHGTVETPAFMPVGTQATVKGLTVDQIRSTGSQMILGNTYHLALRPNEKLIADLGGLHRFMGWDGPILTDSGGFQVFSLAERTKITDHSVVFHSHIDGSRVEFTPERAVEIQEALGSDVAMVLDHVVGLPAPRELIAEAMQRSLAWAARCLAAAQRPDQALFAIVQGGLEPDLRQESARQLAALNFPGYAIGGLSVGEPPPQMYAMLDITVPELPTAKPRYLMGVGRPQDLLEAVARGVDMFDCVMPTRNGRNALAFTWAGPMRLRNAQFSTDPRPLEPDCPCLACRHSRAYLRHLFMAKEMLGPILLTHHNITFYQRLLSAARSAIETNTYSTFASGCLARWSGS